MTGREKPSERLARLVAASRPCSRCGAPAIARVERADGLGGSDRLKVWGSELVCDQHYPAVYDAAPPGWRKVVWLD